MEQQPRETAGTTVRLIIEYVRRTQGEDGVRRMLALAGETRPLSVLEDERVWSSYAAKIALFEAAATVTGDPDVARRIGESALSSAVGASLKLLLGLVGSPSQLVRGIARANAKFSTAAEMTPVSSDATTALIRYRVHDEHVPSGHDCGYTRGLLSQVPAIFELPPAEVVHETCQLHGADACLYLLRWQPRARRFPLPRAARARQRANRSSAVLHQRLRDLQETVAELVGGRSVDEVLTVVAEHAPTAVGAQRFLLVAGSGGDAPPRVHADGFTEEEAERAAATLLADHTPETDEHVIVAPVRSLSRDYGRLAAFSRGGFFDHEDELLRSYASLAATALDAITALDEARDRQGVAEVLLGFARALLETGDRSEVARTTAEAAVALAAGDAATLLLHDEADGALRAVGSSGWPEDLRPLVAELVIRRTDTPELLDLVAHPDRARVYDRRSSDAYVREILATFQASHIVVVPLRSGTRLWGVVITAWLTDTHRPCVQRLGARLSGLADQAVAALERAELAEQVRRQATLDALTGVANRRTFTDRLDHTLAQRNGGPPAGVIFLDLDGFKQVNDTLGHGAGDELLCAVAERLVESVRAEDLVARLGGDEFTILLPDVDGTSGLAECAARVLDAFRSPLQAAEHAIQVRPSVGAVLVGAGHASSSDVLRNADVAMYAAKKAGGGRYVLHRDPLPAPLR